MAADESAAQRSQHLSGILGRNRIAQNAARDGVRDVVADDAGDAWHQTAQRQPHEKAQDDQLPAAGHERLRDQQQSGQAERNVDDPPVADTVSQLAQARRGQDAAQRGGGHDKAGHERHPRGGDFLYSNLEFELMKDEIRHAKELGADGVVFGILTADGQVDVERTRALVELAAPLPVTFHRAFDMTPDLDAALEAVIATGAVRILTSGGAPSVPEGIDAIARVVERAAGRIRIMPGGGVKPSNVAEIARATGAIEFHSSARAAYPSKMAYRKPGIAMGDSADREYTLYAASEETVHALADALGALQAQ